MPIGIAPYVGYLIAMHMYSKTAVEVLRSPCVNTYNKLFSTQHQALLHTAPECCLFAQNQLASLVPLHTFPSVQKKKTGSYNQRGGCCRSQISVSTGCCGRGIVTRLPAVRMWRKTCKIDCMRCDRVLREEVDSAMAQVVVRLPEPLGRHNKSDWTATCFMQFAV